MHCIDNAKFLTTSVLSDLQVDLHQQRLASMCALSPACTAHVCCRPTAVLNASIT